MKRVVLLILTVGFIAWNAPAAYSCSCDIYLHRKDFREAKAIFIGRVVSISSNEIGDAESRRQLPYAVKLFVEKMWKGRKSSEIAILSNNGTGGCGGFQFREGERFLVYAFGKELIAYSACERSRPMSRESEETAKDMKPLNSFWFRSRARLLPF